MVGAASTRAKVLGWLRRSRRPEVTVREAQPADTLTLSRLHRQALGEALDLTPYLQDANCRVLTAVSAGQPVGMAILVLNSLGLTGQPVAEIGSVVVSPELRGRGIGRSMVGRAVELAREAGQSPHLGVLESNVGAQHLYKEMGFEFVAYPSGRFTRVMPEEREPAFLMRFPLGDPQAEAKLSSALGGIPSRFHQIRGQA